MFALLGTMGARVMNRGALAESVWPDSDEHKALNRLRTALVAIRAAFPDRELLVTDRTTVALQPGSLQSDLSQVDADFRHARVTQDPAEELAVHQKLDEVLSQGFLPGWRDEWVIPFQVMAETRLREVQVRRIHLGLELQDYDDARATAAKVLAVDDDEEVWTSYLRLMAMAGQSAEAIQKFREARAKRQSQTGVDFSAELVELAKRVHQGHLSETNSLPVKISQSERDLVVSFFERQIDTDPRAVLELCARPAFRYEGQRSPMQALSLIKRVINRTEPGDPYRNETLILNGYLAGLVGDHATVFDSMEEVLEHTTPDQFAHRRAMTTYAFTNFELRNWDAANEMMKRYYEYALEYGETSELGTAECQVGSLLWHQMKLDECDEHYEKSLQHFLKLDSEFDSRNLTVLYGNMAFAATIRRDWVKARHYADLTLRRAIVERVPMCVNSMMAVRSMLHAEAGEKGQARQFAAQGLVRTFRDRFFRMHQVSADYVAGVLALVGRGSEALGMVEAYTRFRAADHHEHSPAELHLLDQVRDWAGNAKPCESWAETTRTNRLVTTACELLES